ncbi:crotonase/enoyl-CoA hydratase family protein [Sphingorhabdus sp. SMR4y]|uniref:crotonase/enoyl-CoA hydratase family protein n=1 Tax=Sphingorhabdus sp. SMR4y TaxID=2584094 RepID=UPI000B622892|nr:crotonase/enoyl-CoA hydratase family protein [Sphingorhabdus sp. SMR4y]ASK87916.1 2,3-dehydroadipyl-CoA hydratase [Sphingorhabdus sp. SMR4y]
MDFRSRAANELDRNVTIEANDMLVQTPPVAEQDIFSKQFSEIDLRFDRSDEIFWCYMNQKSRPSYTYALGEEIQQVQDWIHSTYGTKSNQAADPLRYFVAASHTPGIYNLGGDLKHFADCIRRRDLGALKKYARTCVHMQYENSTGFGAPIITMALVQGDALGGGFEHALAFDILVAEKSARLGLPEILFNLFPGMGAYSFLRQRLSRKETERFILEGKLYTGAQLYDMGVVDILADDGMGEAAIVEYTKENRKRFHAERAVYRARKIANPVSLEELLEITDTWAETALYLEDADVRKMERLASAQDRRIMRSLRAV